MTSTAQQRRDAAGLPSALAGWRGLREPSQHGERGVAVVSLAKRIEERILDKTGTRFTKHGGGGVLQSRHRYYTEN